MCRATPNISYVIRDVQGQTSLGNESSDKTCRRHVKGIIGSFCRGRAQQNLRVRALSSCTHTHTQAHPLFRIRSHSTFLLTPTPPRNRISSPPQALTPPAPSPLALTLPSPLPLTPSLASLAQSDLYDTALCTLLLEQPLDVFHFAFAPQLDGDISHTVALDPIKR